MVIMMIIRVLVDKLLHQGSRGWSPLFENLPTGSMRVYGYAPSCPALNGSAPQKPCGRGSYPVPKDPGSQGGVCMAKWQDSVHFTIMGVSPISFVPKFSSFYVGGPSLLARSGGVIPGTGCVVPQLFAAGGNRLYLDFSAITGDPRYPRYKTPTLVKVQMFQWSMNFWMSSPKNC
jgi:hypothetical protein